MDIFFCGPQTDLLIWAHTPTQEYVPYRVVVDDVVCTNDPLSTSLNIGTLRLWPPIDLDGLLSLVDLFGCFLLASPSTHTFVLIGSVRPLPYSLNRCTINITVLTLESPSSYLLAWGKGNSIIRLRYRLTVSSSSLALHWSPSSNDRQCCLKHGMKQRSPTNAIRCTLRLYTRLLMWFWFIRAPSSHGCMLAPPIHVFISLALDTAAPSVVITLLLYSSWYWYWWWYWWCAHIIPSVIHLQGSRARVSGE